jgi:hypothetical protein
MKLISSLIYYIYFLFAIADIKIIKRKCFSRLECIFDQAQDNEKVLENIEKCRSYEYDAKIDEITCINKAYGLNDEQSKLFINIVYSIDKCNPNNDPNMRNCVDKCNPAINSNCSQSCGEVYQLIVETCLAKLANKPNFDVKKSIQCANSCNQATVSEVFDCDYNCKREIYDNLIINSKAENLDKPSSSQETKPEDNSDSKSTKSNGYTNEISREGSPIGTDSNQSNSTNTKFSEDGSNNNDSSPKNSSNIKNNENRTTKIDPKPSTSPQSGSPGYSDARLTLEYASFYNISIIFIAFLFI